MAALNVRSWEAEAKILWETTEISARDIGEKFGVSKSTVIGMARRREWNPRFPDPGTQRTLDDRIDAIWQKFAEEMAECDILQDISRKIWKIRDDRYQRDQAAD